MGWGTGNIGGGGGASLNFKVVGGTTAPSNPKENTIWVNTDAEISSWVFSATEPESPEEGMLWISTDTSSPVEFNALKKNSIQVYPLSAKQYVGGALVGKTAKTYQGGTWVDWITYIYNMGWIAETALVDYHGGSDGGNAITITYRDGYITLNRTKWDGYAAAYTNKNFDLTGINTLYCKTGDIGSGGGDDGESSGTQGSICFGVGLVSDATPVAKVRLKNSNTVYALDVSGVNGAHRIGFYHGGTSNSDWVWSNRKIGKIYY